MSFLAWASFRFSNKFLRNEPATEDRQRSVSHPTPLSYHQHNNDRGVPIIVMDPIFDDDSNNVTICVNGPDDYGPLSHTGHNSRRKINKNGCLRRDYSRMKNHTDTRTDDKLCTTTSADNDIRHHRHKKLSRQTLTAPSTIEHQHLKINDVNEIFFLFLILQFYFSCKHFI